MFLLQGIPEHHKNLYKLHLCSSSIQFKYHTETLSPTHSIGKNSPIKGEEVLIKNQSSLCVPYNMFPWGQGVLQFYSNRSIS